MQVYQFHSFTFRSPFPNGYEKTLKTKLALSILYLVFWTTKCEEKLSVSNTKPDI